MSYAAPAGAAGRRTPYVGRWGRGCQLREPQ